MKTLRVNDLLIVEYNEIPNFICDANIVISNGVAFEIQDNHEFICKGSELTEEIASTLIKKGRNSYNEETYQNFYDDIGSFMGFDYALPSIISLIESKGFYWGINPHGELIGCCSGRDCGCMGMPINVSSQKEIDDILEAESKTFNLDQTLIFKIVE